MFLRRDKMNKSNNIAYRTLMLNLDGKWYDMIEKGIKKEEYRVIKDHWSSRLFLSGDWKYFQQEFKHLNPTPEDVIDEFELSAKKTRLIKKHYEKSELRLKVDKVKFVYGYTKRTMTFEIEDVVIGTGNPEWGAENGVEYYVIKLGKRID